MAIGLRRRGPSKFQRAADGSMTLIEHIRELRNRLFWASLAVVVGFIVGYILSQPTFDLLREPYCKLPGAVVNGKCQAFFQLSPTDGFVIRLKIALWLGLIVSGPVWFYQLWAFVAPGLHRHERKWAYVFVSIAAPLFMGGAALAYFVVDKGLRFLLDAGVTGTSVALGVQGYISFVTTMILLFGVAFEFPLLLLMLNFTGIASARRLLSWWRAVIFICFAFAAVATPDPGPFGMTLLALALSLLYFIAVGVAYVNDRRRARKENVFAGLDDDEASPLDDVGLDVVERGEPVETPAPVATPLPLDRRYDDST